MRCAYLIYNIAVDQTPAQVSGGSANLLQLMYQEPARWSFTFQSFSCLSRLKAVLEPPEESGGTPGTAPPVRVFERSLFSDRYPKKGGTGTPKRGARVPQKWGTGTPKRGTGTPKMGHGYPKQGHRYPKKGHRYPKNGARVPKKGGHRYPKKGHRYPKNGARVPQKWGTGTLERGAQVPQKWGTGTPNREARVPQRGAQVPQKWGTGTPNRGTGTPKKGTGTPKMGHGYPRKGGTGTPKKGTGTPNRGTGTPNRGTGTPKRGARVPQKRGHRYPKKGHRYPKKGGTGTPKRGPQVPQKGAQVPQKGAQKKPPNPQISAKTPLGTGAAPCPSLPRYVFAKTLLEAGHLQPLEWAIYQDWHELLLRHLAPHAAPHGFLYLRASPQTCLERLRRRARSEEGGVQLGYLEQLHGQHELWLVARTTEIHCEAARRAPVLVLDVEQDFEHDLARQGLLMAQVEAFVTSLGAHSVPSHPEPLSSGHGAASA
ncbi:deoxyguanosine kinase, mitochondrial isoform X3 [Molothrus aeneus]|uniref:deoxyguanosine kinase, mitochondrial isoform X3 n=1 Tax=Molothrus aeneus TaxID=84833 RepID=UPI00345AEABC